MYRYSAVMVLVAYGILSFICFKCSNISMMIEKRIVSVDDIIALIEEIPKSKTLVAENHHLNFGSSMFQKFL